MNMRAGNHHQKPGGRRSISGRAAGWLPALSAYKARAGAAGSCAVLLAAILCCLSFAPADNFGLTAYGAASDKISQDPDTGLTVTEKTIPMKGLDRTCQVLVVADLQMILKDDPQVDEDSEKEVQDRLSMFVTPEGESAEDLWKRLPAALDGFGADLILFAGDIVDFATEKSTSAMKEGFDSLKTPWMYVRGDHDYGAWYSRDFESQKDAIDLQKKAAPRRKVMMKKVGGLTVIGWDNDTTQMTKKGLRLLEKDLAETTGPAIFLAHVPFLGEKTEDLADLSLEKRGKVLLWGDRGDCRYKPDEETGQALADILGEDSPVQLVVSGHLHFPYQGPLTDTVDQIVVSPAFLGNVTKLVLVPAGD